MIVEGPDGQKFDFPDGTGHDVIDHELTQFYSSKGADITKDMINSGIQGVRNVAEGLIAAPGIADDLEKSAVEWLKSQGDDSVLGRLGNNYEAVTNAVHANDVAMPNYGDVQWLEKMGGLRDQYQPQTPAGNLAYGGAVAGLGGAIAGPAAGGALGSLARNPMAQQFGRGALQGAGIGTGAGALYKLWNQLGGQ